MPEKSKTLQFANTVLMISTALAIVILIFLMKENSRLKKERLNFKQEIRQLVGSISGVPMSQVDDVVPVFEASNLKGEKLKTDFAKSSGYLMYIFSPECEVCSKEFDRVPNFL